MHPSIVLAAALAAAGASLPAFAQTAPVPPVCARPAEVPPDAAAPDAPFDASEALDAAVWSRAQAAGVKLDAAACRLRAADGHALTRREVDALKAAKRPGEPGAKDPDKDAKKTERARAAVDAAAAGGAAATYGDSKARFDGAAARSGETSVASGGGASGPGAPGESTLSAALNAGIRAKFAEEEAGRALLAHFTDGEGTVRLPGVALVDYNDSTVATYDAQDRLIHLNQSEAAKAAASSAPESERAALAKRLAADPVKLSAYFVEHPEARAALIDQQAETFFHETFHAWQHRRDPPVEGALERNPVEPEREAFREELRFFHERLQRDPSLIDRAPDADMYKRLLAGYPEFKTYVTELYRNTYGDTDFATTAQLLAKRAKAGKRGAESDLASVRKDQAAYERNENDFAANVLPAMQAESYPKLIARSLEKGKPADALALAAAAPESVRNEAGPRALAATLDYFRRDPPAPLAERMDAWQSYIAYLGKTTGGNVMPPGDFALYSRDCREEVASRLAEALRSRGQARGDALDWAEFYAGVLPDKERVLQTIKAARARRPGT
ncbi:MAG TPA: hypothetical protein VN915_10740 [Elusimicrobiota bacterium]|nr:hypothetical protein [Elusimicrobiota bacterium]